MRQKIRRTIMLISFLIFPVTLNFFSPYLVVAGAFAGIIVGSLCLFAMQFASSLVLGRAFCGWACPAGALQDFVTLINPSRAPGGKANWIKYFIWAPWFATIIAGFIRYRGINSVQPLFLTESGISVSEPMMYITYFGVIGIFVLLAFFFGRRAFCHYACWMAPFMVIGRKASIASHLPSLHLSSAKEQCTQCGTCTSVCPMSIDVKANVALSKMEHAECALCGECVDSCPKKVISYRLLRSGKKRYVRTNAIVTLLIVCSVGIPLFTETRRQYRETTRENIETIVYTSTASNGIGVTTLRAADGSYVFEHSNSGTIRFIDMSNHLRIERLGNTAAISLGGTKTSESMSDPPWMQGMFQLQEFILSGK